MTTLTPPSTPPNVRIFGLHETFDERLADPITSAVINPKPMPINFIAPQQLDPFIAALKENASVHDTDHREYLPGLLYNDGRMDLCKVGLGAAVRDVIDALNNNTFVQHFLIGNNLVGTAGAKAINAYLKRDTPSRIKTWYLAGNCLDADAIALIADGLMHDQVCDALWLKRNPIGLGGLAHLSTLINANRNLRLLDLDNCGLLDAGVQLIMNALTASDGLRHLYLSANGITADGARRIAQYFDHCRSAGKAGLRSLYLSANRIGDDGAVAIAESLRHNGHLKRLILASNRIESRGAAALADCLMAHPTLQVLYLGVHTSTVDMGELPNRVGMDGAMHIARLIATNHHLTLVTLAHNKLNIQAVEALVEAAKQSPSILQLEIVERGLDWTMEKAALDAHLLQNIRSRFGADESALSFYQTHFHTINSTPRARSVSSIYRTRELNDRKLRKQMKKHWDDDTTLQEMLETHLI